MDCPECGATTIAFPLEADLASYLPGDESGAALCTRCLSLHPVGNPPAAVPSFDAMADAYPSDPDAGVPMALVLGLLSSLALYRDELSGLLTRVERAGTDPLLVIDRLDADPSIDSAVDLGRRRRQLEALI